MTSFYHFFSHFRTGILTSGHPVPGFSLIPTRTLQV